VELRSQLVEPLPPQPPAAPTEAEQWLEEEIQQLRKELQAQVQDNEKLSHLNTEQEEQLLELE
jgi:hypothetical protein